MFPDLVVPRVLDTLSFLRCIDRKGKTTDIIFVMTPIPIFLQVRRHKGLEQRLLSMEANANIKIILLLCGQS
jgi:hypothetical protein